MKKRRTYIFSERTKGQYLKINCQYFKTSSAVLRNTFKRCEACLEARCQHCESLLWNKFRSTARETQTNKLLAD